jgi:hypothetical protein
VCTGQLAEGDLTVHEAMAQRSDDGRLLLLNVDWAGHQLTLACAYLPSSNTAARRQFISTRLSDSYTRCLASGREPLLGGDFNFIADGTLDHLPACQQADGVAAERQQQRLGGQSVDIYRHRWPRARQVTRFQHHSAPRLDRLYISASAQHRQ